MGFKLDNQFTKYNECCYANPVMMHVGLWIKCMYWRKQKVLGYLQSKYNLVCQSAGLSNHAFSVSLYTSLLEGTCLHDFKYLSINRYEMWRLCRYLWTKKKLFDKITKTTTHHKDVYGDKTVALLSIEKKILYSEGKVI